MTVRDLPKAATADLDDVDLEVLLLVGLHAAPSGASGHAVHRGTLELESTMALQNGDTAPHFAAMMRRGVPAALSSALTNLRHVALVELIDGGFALTDVGSGLWETMASERQVDDEMHVKRMGEIIHAVHQDWQGLRESEFSG